MELFRQKKSAYFQYGPSLKQVDIAIIHPIRPVEKLAL
jgi:hypothetical protein